MWIDRSTYEKMTNKDKLNTLFDIVQDTHKEVKQIKNRKWVHMACSTAGGFAGGFVAVLLLVKNPSLFVKFVTSIF